MANDGIKILDEIINNKVNQILVYPQPYHKLNVSQENYENHKIITVKIPNSNNEDLIIEFLKSYTVQGKVYCMYFKTEELYKSFCRVYLQCFSESGPKLIRCTQIVTTITDREEQIVQIKSHHEGKRNHRGINETLEHLKRKYYWKNMKTAVTNYINECEICQRTKYA